MQPVELHSDIYGRSGELGRARLRCALTGGVQDVAHGVQDERKGAKEGDEGEDAGVEQLLIVQHVGQLQAAHRRGAWWGIGKTLHLCMHASQPSSALAATSSPSQTTNAAMHPTKVHHVFCGF